MYCDGGNGYGVAVVKGDSDDIEAFLNSKS